MFFLNLFPSDSLPFIASTLAQKLFTFYWKNNLSAEAGTEAAAAAAAVVSTLFVPLWIMGGRSIRSIVFGRFLFRIYNHHLLLNRGWFVSTNVHTFVRGSKDYLLGKGHLFLSAGSMAGDNTTYFFDSNDEAIYWVTPRWLTNSPYQYSKLQDNVYRIIYYSHLIVFTG